MKRTIKYSCYALTVISTLAIVWSFGVIKRNHVNYVELVESYGKLVQVYEGQYDHKTYSPEVLAKIEYLNSEITVRSQKTLSSSVKPNVSYYYMWLFLGLVGIGIAEKILGKHGANSKGGA